MYKCFVNFHVYHIDYQSISSRWGEQSGDIVRLYLRCLLAFGQSSNKGKRTTPLDFGPCREAPERIWCAKTRGDNEKSGKSGIVFQIPVTSVLWLLYFAQNAKNVLQNEKLFAREFVFHYLLPLGC